VNEKSLPPFPAWGTGNVSLTPPPTSLYFILLFQDKSLLKLQKKANDKTFRVMDMFKTAVAIDVTLYIC
jgi:hypothetical protein